MRNHWEQPSPEPPTSTLAGASEYLMQMSSSLHTPPNVPYSSMSQPQSSQSCKSPGSMSEALWLSILEKSDCELWGWRFANACNHQIQAIYGTIPSNHPKNSAAWYELHSSAWQWHCDGPSIEKEKARNSESMKAWKSSQDLTNLASIHCQQIPKESCGSTLSERSDIYVCM